MGLYNKAEKKELIKTGIASLAATAVVSNTIADVNSKEQGKIKAVAVFGSDDSYNGMGHEIHIRKIFESKKDWQIISVRSSKLFTPEIIEDADLLIICNMHGADPIDYFSQDAGISDTIKGSAPFWTDMNVGAVIDNVKNRGMGLIVLNNTILSGNRQFSDFLDIREVNPHEIEPLWVTKINKNHPIMNDTGKFLIDTDKQLAVIIKSTTTDTLFQTTAIHEKRQAVSGWALESGKGRIVGLLPGVTIDAYKTPEYQNIIWRSAHWVIKRDIQKYPNAENRYYP